MTTKERWVFVDDQREEAQAFAQELSRDAIEVQVIDPGQAKETLLTAKDTPGGVLIDVDLSNFVGEHGTGPGIAQDIRVKQRAHEVEEFPIVRFAGLEPIRKSILGDPASDDLFDLKIPKEALREKGPVYIVELLRGVSLVYKALKDIGKATDDSLLPLLGLSAEAWDRTGHSGFSDRLLSSLQVATHVAAGTFIRSFLLPPGLLIDERLLAVRLGVDAVASGKAWPDLLKSVPFSYVGVGHEAFPRWWARGLDEWWFNAIGQDEPLSSLDAKTRVALLGERAGFKDLTPLSLPHGSAGSKPWRHCSLSAEEAPPRFLPLDPSESVRLTGRVDLPPWVDPAYAALGPALQARDDFRRNRSDLDRLSRKYKAS